MGFLNSNKALGPGTGQSAQAGGAHFIPSPNTGKGSLSYGAIGDFSHTLMSNPNKGLFSCWVKPTLGYDSYPFSSMASGNLCHYLDVNTEPDSQGVPINLVYFVIEANSGGRRNIAQQLPITPGVWSHVAVSWNLDAALTLCVNDVSTASFSADNFGSTNTPTEFYMVGSLGGSIGAFLGDISEVLLEDNFYMDLTIQANRRKFRTASGRPAFLGADGSLISGSQPIVYLKGTGAAMNVNSGSAGNFTVVGDLTNPTTTPSNP